MPPGSTETSANTESVQAKLAVHVLVSPHGSDPYALLAFIPLSQEALRKRRAGWSPWPRINLTDTDTNAQS